MQTNKMIVLDLDNTLLRKDKTISEYTKTILIKCRESGYLIVFATARPERTTRQWQLTGNPMYVIANNGATMTHNRKEIINISVSDDIKNSLINRFVNDDTIKGITVEVGELLYTNDKDYETWASFGNDTGWNPVFHNFLTPINEKACKFSIECKSPDVIKNILLDYPGLHLFPNNNENWHQITHNTASKYNAIKYLSNLTGIAINHITAFGDDYNDVEMIKECGIGVAVANAVSNAKEAADYICESNDNDGVAKYIDEFLLSKM